MALRRKALIGMLTASLGIGGILAVSVSAGGKRAPSTTAGTSASKVFEVAERPALPLAASFLSAWRPPPWPSGLVLEQFSLRNGTPLRALLRFKHRRGRLGREGPRNRDDPGQRDQNESAQENLVWEYRDGTLRLIRRYKGFISALPW